MVNKEVLKMTIEELIEDLKKHPDQQSNVVAAIRCSDDFWTVSETIVNENNDIQLLFS